ncbi:DUF5304 domain-containing protein [Streptomyces sp. NPDC085596]|uniref:DUF5304 domain-containing protein n=1 Tax=Streptomyces sp. NPDC085596 TaxID=3365731 RepID=UPI0037D44A82
MSEERPAPQPSEEPEAPQQPRVSDADAWATATAEDLAAEKARRRGTGAPPPGTAAEELRRLMDTVADKLTGLQSPLLGAVAGPAAQQAVRQMVQQAKAAVEPVVERNPQVFDHLAAAGSELLAAYRSAVQAQEHRWTTSAPTPPPDGTDPAAGRRDPGEGTGPGERIDLD